MGLLDRMLAGAIEQSTGFKARKLVRMVGSKRLLTLGGAAIAGGMLAQNVHSKGGFGRGLGAGSEGGNVVPPKSSAESTRRSQLPPTPAPPSGLPPLPVDRSANPSPPGPPPVMPTSVEAPDLPTVSDLPDLPGLPDGASHSNDQQFELVALRTVVAAAMADGEIASEERTLLQEHLGQADLSPEQKVQVQSELLSPAAPAELAAAFPAGEDPTSLLALSIVMMRADGELCDVERNWLQILASGLGVGEDRVRQIEAELYDTA